MKYENITDKLVPHSPESCFFPLPDQVYGPLKAG